MDKSQHSKLSRAFEQAAEQEALAHPLPDQLWDSIAQDLLANTPVESAERIQQAYEEQATTALPPANLWDNIAKGLGNNKIKESFETKESLVVPTAIWNDIEEQLEIESVWKKVQKALDQRTNWLYWREKMLQGSLLLLILLWLRGCEWEQQPAEPIASEPVAANTANHKVGSTTNSKTKTRYSTTAPIQIEEQIKTNKEPNNAINLEKTRTTKIAKSVLSPKENPTTYIAPNATRIASNHLPKNLSNINTRSTNFGESLLAIDNIKAQTTVEQLPKLEERFSPINKDKISIQPRANTKEKFSLSHENPSAISPIVTTNPITVDAKNKTVPLLQADPKSTENLSTLTTDNITNTFVLTLEAIELQKVEQARQKRQNHIEFGMEARVRGAVLLGSMTTEAMESNSMMKTKLMPTVAVGANLAWYFTYNDALVVALHPMAASRQYFGGYTEEGRYYHKEIKLSYFDIEAAYQRTLFHYNDFGALPSTVYARLSYGFGYLNKGETILNGMTTDETPLYNNTNHNFGLNLGTTHRLQRWVIDYGIYGQLGISTIHLQQPANYSQLLGIGAYLGLRYSL